MDEILEGWDKDLYDKLSFDFLIECAEKKKIDEWNALYLEYLESEWKRLYPDRKWDPENVFELVMRWPDFKKPTFFRKDFREVRSRGVYFARAHLEGADFIEAHLERADFMEAHLEGADFRAAHLERANFIEAHLDSANFIHARLDGAYFIKARLDGASFMDARLEGANFMDAHLEGANFREAHLERAIFRNTHLERAIFINARLEWADFRVAHLDGVDFMGAHLEAANFTYAVVDGGTIFSDISINDKTNFSGTALSATRIDPNLRTKLERNIREIQWKKWYDEPKIFGKKQAVEEGQEYNPSLFDKIFINPFVRLFWWVSNYGSSTKRVIGVFFAWNIFWAFIYQFVLPLQSVPILAGTNTMVLDTPNIITAVMQTNLMMFSITDVATRNLDYPALIFVTVQIVIGYFILAALITRLGIMFQNLSP